MSEVTMIALQWSGETSQIRTLALRWTGVRSDPPAKCCIEDCGNPVQHGIYVNNPSGEAQSIVNICGPHYTMLRSEKRKLDIILNERVDALSKWFEEQTRDHYTSPAEIKTSSK